MLLTIYKTKKEITKIEDISLEDLLLSGPTKIKTYAPYKVTFETRDDYAWDLYYNANQFYKKYDIPAHPAWPVEEIQEHYETFYIPKKTGGMRRIDAPDAELKEYLALLTTYFTGALKMLTHDAAHAYVKGRSCKTAIQAHQHNNSKWFLKIDIHDFFGSHTFEYVWNTLKEMYPICFLIEDSEDYENALKEALQYAFLDNKLPQGTPLSPFLTNVLMTNIDYKIQNYLWDRKSNFCYTRYADDILISSKYTFKYSEIVSKIKEILQNENAPFTINNQKTRYGSAAGSNWNLGLMLNKDNNITLGHKKKQTIRAMLNNLFKDFTTGSKWTTDEVNYVQGWLSYLKNIEPAYAKAIIKRYELKYNTELKKILKAWS